MKIIKRNPILGIINSYGIDSPQPSNISYIWNYGSLLGLCLVIQIITGITLAMHYNSSTDLAFLSVEHIMRDVNNGWIIRYIHANTASLFFIFIYCHMGRGLYYGSYRQPRAMLWSIGVIIFILLIGTGFLGYTLVYGTMSYWGKSRSQKWNKTEEEKREKGIVWMKGKETEKERIKRERTETKSKSSEEKVEKSVEKERKRVEKASKEKASKKKPEKENPKKKKGKREAQAREKRLSLLKEWKKSRAKMKAVPEGREIIEEGHKLLEILTGSLLGDGSAERRKTTRIKFYQEGKHATYIKYLHKLLEGYCNEKEPEVRNTQRKGVATKTISFTTWSYENLNWLHEEWYENRKKRIPRWIGEYLTPMALGIWIMDDGSWGGSGTKLATNAYTYEECEYLVKLMKSKYNFEVTIQKSGTENQWLLYIKKESMEELRKQVQPHMVKEFYYKLGI